eukprot:725840-Pelagomonas_calceolata.AAC.1
MLPTFPAGRVQSSTTPAKQHHKLDIENHHIDLIELKYCGVARPGAQLNASKQQHCELCNKFEGAEITLHTILLGRSIKFARNHPWNLHAHSVQRAHKPCLKLTSTKRVIENKAQLIITPSLVGRLTVLTLVAVE